jgi:hypothetical protein
MKRWQIALVVSIVIGSAAPAVAWQFVETMNSFGDAATGIVQPARDAPGALLAIGCDGDRWRIVAVGPPMAGGIELDQEGEVRTSFAAELGPKEKWQVHKRGAQRDVLIYLAPAPSGLVRQMLDQEKASADAVFRVSVRSAGKPVVLAFPLAGLRAAIRKELWEPCKLGNQIPESEFDQP